MAVYHTEDFTLLSFELTEKFSAWFEKEDETAHEVPIHAIGLAKVEAVTRDASTNNELRRELVGNFVVGLDFCQDGVHICDESSNFLCLLPRGAQYESDSAPTRAAAPQSDSQPHA